MAKYRSPAINNVKRISAGAQEFLNFFISIILSFKTTGGSILRIAKATIETPEQRWKKNRKHRITLLKFLRIFLEVVITKMAAKFIVTKPHPSRREKQLIICQVETISEFSFFNFFDHRHLKEISNLFKEIHFKLSILK